MTENEARARPAVTMFLWVGVFVALVVYGMSLNPGGYVHYEGQFFLSAQLDDRPLFARLFSAHFNEWDCYQGRELSFLAGILDAQLLALSARLGLVHLYSLVACACLVGTAVLLWRLLPELTGIDRFTSGLVASLFLSSPVAALSTFYYRPAKALTAFFLAVVLTVIVRLTRSRETESHRRSAFALAVAATLMGLSDRIGVYLIFAIAVIVAIRYWPLDSRSRSAIGALGAALATITIWSVAIGPYLARAVDGQLPDTTNELVALRYTFGNFIHYRTALSLWLEQISFAMGSRGAISLICLALPVAIGIGRRKGVERRVMFATVAAIALALVLYTMIYAKLNSVAWPASRRVYYWIPTAVATAIGIAFVFGRAVSVRPGARPVTLAMLVLMVISNIAALPSHAAVVAAGEQRPQILEAPQLRECIRDNSFSQGSAMLSPAARLVCYRVRRAVSGESVKNDVPPEATPNPLLYCRNARARQPALRSLGP